MNGGSLNEMSNGRAGKFDNGPPIAAAAARLARRGLWQTLAVARRTLPQACALCADRCDDAILCDPCMNTLPALPVACPVCANPSPAGRVCGACLVRPPAYATTIAACRYAFPLDRLVQGLKYERRIALAQPLGDALAAAVLRAPTAYARPQALVPLPLAAPRQRERGFNQSIEIARVVARRTGVPMVHGLARTSAAPPQASLPWSARRRNVRSAFAARGSFAGGHVAIVDDVMTTGATLDAAAAALRKAGAARVDAWIVARTLPPGID